MVDFTETLFIDSTVAGALIKRARNGDTLLLVVPKNSATSAGRSISSVSLTSSGRLRLATKPCGLYLPEFSQLPKPDGASRLPDSGVAGMIDPTRALLYPPSERVGALG